MSNEIDKKLFKQIFGHTLEALANKLIDTTNKEKNFDQTQHLEMKNLIFYQIQFHN